MEFYSTTDVGKKRKNNEDAFINYNSDDFDLFIVADGMGGYSAGEIASNMAVNIIKDYIVKNFDKENIFDLIAESVRDANDAILQKSLKNEECRGMGTTIVIAIIVDDCLYFSNVGDSRIYLYSEDNFRQISKDHSYVQELLDIGAITEEDAKFYPKNLVTSAVGIENTYKININKIPLSPNDNILLCTDGLTDLIDDIDIEDVLQNKYEAKESCEILQYMANSTGGYDNITITIIKY
ncbi:Stp1/IreP family PP2C-type Ser/Thr phosphatase [Helcococcus ovis]|uniref:Stp1/IreP family PP2C-type Ser/Thr phosphatase n=1 Tax=Helcococcus ovis TaxID=72026 RepID=A0A4R9C4S0_9FIRM|nr:Stp1/IreP family PP2C-type Ser/Thr phosphatase [Helcococcus ovis]TFF64396.1 Stp1/IreP family PP2C-type Ser/Thr phosphatase [Helcococcus ovis]TFF67129.1 Stp1/IreP family PP2C-type Ser/Thr phosphatase [Helcococcus ovis]